MLDNLGIVFAFICFLLGGVLLYVIAPNPEPSHTAGLFGGAALLSLGLVTILRVLRNKLQFRRNYKKWREG